MGYTHYWETKKRPTNKQWDKIQNAIALLLNSASVKGLVQYESDKETPPLVNAEVVRFNGIAEKGHETFYLDRDPTGFEFCKTADKPYDIAVTAVLVIVEGYAPDCYSVTSDGMASDWESGLSLTQTIDKNLGLPKGIK